MESVNEISLSTSEFQDVNELNAEELEAVTGGVWGAIGFAVDWLFGGSDEPNENHTNVENVTVNNGNVTINNCG
ncbi:hypothetical protein H6F93_18690 [Leptolyngbya sp. FACHB-671]|uniref:hypothetical protein n=1 Tax=Leptolyngbya sp. FACHB-671 TaxID=2692812 RepID=UPI00168827F5|nr:hypothetical protein [Leptolyngbya sp. FACHB-671]MBD2069526.1 hypothetical protein [Leptolyngbya sp. FACHB-671]